MSFDTGDGEVFANPDDCEGCEGPNYYDKNQMYARWWSSDVKPDKGLSGQLVVPEGDKMQWNSGSLRYLLKPDMPARTIFVEKSTMVSGRVTDPNGQPVEGASVACVHHGKTRGSRAKTDKDGRYLIDLPASKNAKYNPMVHDSEPQQTRNWANGVSAAIQTTPGQTVENFDLQMSRLGSVKGRVLHKGEPVEFIHNFNNPDARLA